MEYQDGLGGSSTVEGGAHGSLDGTLPRAASANNSNTNDAKLEVVRAFGGHELMESVQAALKAQLLERLGAVDAELTSQSEARERAQRAREDVGVELYGVQQRLAQLHVTVEALSGEGAAIREQREGMECDVAAAGASFEERTTALRQADARLASARVALEARTVSLARVGAIRAAVRDEAALRRRVAAKAEEAVAEKEAAKCEQDLYIDGLTRAVAAARDSVGAFDAQMGRWRGESDAASRLISETGAELETITFEKKRLVSEWNSALVAARRRDEAMAALQRDTQAAGEALNSMDAEEGNTGRALQEAQAEHARARGRLDKEVSQQRGVEGACAGLRRTLDGLNERSEALQGTLAATELEVARAKAAQDKLSRRVAEATRMRGLLNKRQAGLEDDIAACLDERVTSTRAAAASSRDAAKALATVRAAEATATTLEKDINAAHLAALELTARIGEQRALGAELGREIGAQEALLARYASEAEQRQDAIVKKMAALDRLNRAYERTKSAAPETEDVGPLRAEVLNLARSARQRRDVIEELQRRWLGHQTSLVAAASEGDAAGGRLRELEGTLGALRTKQSRVDTAADSQAAESARLLAAIALMHKDLGRINALIARNGGAREALLSAALSARRAFNEEIRASERGQATGEARTASAREELERLRGESLEVEKQALLWERRTALERELCAMLDPGEGRSEVVTLTREVAKLRERREGVAATAARTVTELQRAVAKRDDIATQHARTLSATLAAAAASGRGAARASLRPTSSGPTEQQLLLPSLKLAASTKAPMDAQAATRVGLAQRAAALRRELEGHQGSIADASAALQTATAEAQTARASLASREGQVVDLERRTAELQRAIHASAYQRQRASETSAALTRFASRLEAVATGKLPRLGRSEAAKAGRALAEALGARAAVDDVLTGLAQQHTLLAEVVQRVKQLLHVADSLSDENSPGAHVGAVSSGAS